MHKTVSDSFRRLDVGRCKGSHCGIQIVLRLSDSELIRYENGGDLAVFCTGCNRAFIYAIDPQRQEEFTQEDTENLARLKGLADPSACSCFDPDCCKAAGHGPGKCPLPPIRTHYIHRMEYFCGGCYSYETRKWPVNREPVAT